MRGIGWVILFQDPATDRLTNHWVSLHQDGVRLCLEGVSSLEEIRRVTGDRLG